MPDIRGKSGSGKSIDYKSVSQNSKAVSDKQKSDVAKHAAKSVSANEARTKGKSGQSPQSKKDQSRVPQSGGVRVMSDSELRDFKASGGKTVNLNSQSFDGTKDKSRLPGYGGAGKLPDRIQTKPEKDKSRVPQRGDVDKLKNRTLAAYKGYLKSADTIVEPAKTDKPASTNYFKIRSDMTKRTGNPLGLKTAKTATPGNPEYPFSSDGQPTYERWDKKAEKAPSLPTRIIDRIAPNLPGGNAVKGLIDGMLSRDRDKIGNAVKQGIGEIVPGAGTIKSLGEGKLQPKDFFAAGASLIGGLPGYVGSVAVGGLMDEISANKGLRLVNPFEAMATQPGRIVTRPEANRDGGDGAPPMALGGSSNRVETSQAKLSRMVNQSFMPVPTLTKAKDGSYFLDIPKAQTMTPAPSESGSKSILEALSDEAYNPANASFWQGSIVPAAIGLAGVALVIFGAYSLINKATIQVTK